MRKKKRPPTEIRKAVTQNIHEKTTMLVVFQGEKNSISGWFSTTAHGTKYLYILSERLLVKKIQVILVNLR
jgi:hypothetical protein